MSPAFKTMFFSVVLARILATVRPVRPVLRGHSKIDKTKILLNEGRMYCRMLHLEHSAILLACIKRKSVLKINFWSFFESGRLRQGLLYNNNGKICLIIITGGMLASSCLSRKVSVS